MYYTCICLYRHFILFPLTFFLNFFFSVRLLSVLRGHSVFSSPSQRPMTSDFERFLYQIVPITLFSYLNSWEKPVFPFSMLSAKQCNYWYHRLWYDDAVLDWGLNPGPPALDASTLPLGYRVGGSFAINYRRIWSIYLQHRLPYKISCTFRFSILHFLARTETKQVTVTINVWISYRVS